MTTASCYPPGAKQLSPPVQLFPELSNSSPCSPLTPPSAADSQHSSQSGTCCDRSGHVPPRKDTLTAPLSLAAWPCSTAVTCLPSPENRRMCSRHSISSLLRRHHQQDSWPGRAIRNAPRFRPACSARFTLVFVPLLHYIVSLSFFSTSERLVSHCHAERRRLQDKSFGFVYFSKVKNCEWYRALR